MSGRYAELSDERLASIIEALAFAGADERAEAEAEWARRERERWSLCAKLPR